MNQSFFQEAARLNNEGVTALAEGDEETSIKRLTTTVKMMKQFIALPDQAEALASSSDESSSCLRSFSTVEIAHAACDEQVFFRQAILMPSDIDESSPLDVFVYSAAVIFNLALVHHIQGSKNKSARSKAQKLYAAIMRLLGDRVGHMQLSLLLKLACINNMAHIRYENGEFDQVQDGLGQLSTLLKTTDQCLFKGAEIQMLLMNVLFFKKPDIAPAA
ncbi:unnamed protein product [Cylindrotheca closterium]|uniref:Uncharacterized protein n=1 Tax=Cylindrotheca closterium TaxID=2856 RepID=A0AAD2CK28_9STRA|nr:unnamed protein product [Cylindrotheca closterium]CAJ1936617.1 unnamed protein product [Cylindrotheca closterium]